MANSIRRYREKRGLTQMALAYKAGLSERTVRNAESGEDVRMDTLRKIGGVLNVEPDVLLQADVAANV